MVLVPVILSGGVGSRLWPVSRESHPKPFIKLADGESLLLKTYRHAISVLNHMNDHHPCDILTVTNRDHFIKSKDEFVTATSGQSSGYFLLEPEGRNTAPAIAMAAHHVVLQHGPEALMLVLAADHLIQDQLGFSTAVAQAAELASQNYLTTFGIVPTSPECGYGYIEAGEVLHQGRKALRFVEKPTREKANDYLVSGNFYWNSGMFCFKASRLLEQLALHAPEVAKQAKRCWQGTTVQDDCGAYRLDIPIESFALMPNISIDFALMERSDSIAVVPSTFGWCDMGSWNAMKDLVSPDDNNNRVLGEAIFVDSCNTFVQSENRLVATVGIDNLMIIDTPDALLVIDSDRAQDVKNVVTQLKQSNHDSHLHHRTVHRPWGTFSVLEEGVGFKIKRIEVNPGASLSMQLHHHRNEHWIVINGVAKVINGNKEMHININESTYINAGSKHRLQNPGTDKLVMIEVQTGTYLGEDDIVRFDDDYGRARELTNEK